MVAIPLMGSSAIAMPLGMTYTEARAGTALNMGGKGGLLCPPGDG